MENLYVGFCERFGSYFPSKTQPSEEFETAIKYLRWKIKPEKIIGATRIGMLVVAAIFVILSAITFALGANPAIFIIEALTLPLLFNQVLTDYPKTLAKQRAITALGSSPQLIAQLAISIKQNPNLEKAIEFVAEHGEGEIAQDFRRMQAHIWSAQSPSYFKEMPILAEKWGHFSEGFQRSIFLILSSFNERDLKKKAATLDRAVESILGDVLLKMREYSLGLHLPTLILFSFGIIMPLILISLFPLLGFFGIPLSLEAITLFLVTSLAGVWLYSNRILQSRPITFSLPEVKSNVPAGYAKLAGTVVPAFPLAIATAILISSIGLLYLFSLTKVVIFSGGLAALLKLVNTVPIILGVGAAGIVYWYGTGAHLAKERARIKKIDEQVPDALYYISSVLSEGKPFEEAVDYASSMLGKTELAQQLKTIANTIKRRHITVEAALFSDLDKSSNLLKSTFSILNASMKKGSKALVQTCDVMQKYLSRMAKIERSLILMLSKSLSMMKISAMVFAPFVSAIIVVLFAMIVKGVSSAEQKSLILGYLPVNPIAVPSLPIPILQLVLGLYALGLNYVLVRYVTLIQYGQDKIQLKVSLAQSFAVVLVIFTASLIGLSAMLV